jgi:superfamily II DNA or RNA helicase
MELHLGNVFTQVVAADQTEVEFLDGYLTFFDERKFWAKKYYTKGRPVDASLRVYDQRNQRFPAGLTPKVISAARDEGININLSDRRMPPVPPTNAPLPWLDTDPRGEYQRTAIDEALEAGRGIIQLPTGSGKSEVGIGLILRVPCHWLMVVHTADLMHQFAERWRLRTGAECGVVGDGRKMADPMRRLTVATFQTLARNIHERWAQDLLADVEGILVDEAHTLPADTFYRVVMSTRRAYWRFGLSATPLARGDRRSVYAVSALGPVVFRIRTKDLVDKGLLARPIVKMVSCLQNTKRPKFEGQYGDLVVRSTRRNKILVEMMKRCEKPALCFVKQVKHGKQLLERAEKAGLKVAFTWGAKNTGLRKESIGALIRGDYDVLICSVIFQTGIDIPELRAVINGAGGKSAIASIQRAGRGTRIIEGKTWFEVWDVYDDGHKDLEDDEIEPTQHAVAKHTRARIKAYTKEGYEMVMETIE